MTTKQIIRLVLGTVVACYFLWLIIHQSNLQDLKQAFTGTTFRWVAAALFAFAVGYSCRIERWRLMLVAHTPGLKWSNCAGPFLASFAANNVLPFRAGDVLRAFTFNKKLGTSSGVVIATLLVERLLDFLMVTVLFSIALTFFGMNAARFAGVGNIVLISIALLTLVTLLFPHIFAPLFLGLGNMATSISPKIGKTLTDEIEKSLATLQGLARGNTMIKLVVWSLAVWLAEGCVFWFAAVALPLISSPLAGWLALPMGTLATLIPSTPGYIGTFDYFVVQALTSLGNPAVAATAYALLVHTLLWFPPTLIGGLYFVLEPMNIWSKFKE